MEVFLPLLLTLPAAGWSMIGVSLAFAIAAVAINFMIAYAFQSPQMVAVAREELAALIFTVFIILFWGGSDFIFNDLSAGLLLASVPPEYQVMLTSSAQGLSVSHIDLALATIGVMTENLKNQYTELYLFEALIGFLSTISFPFGSPMPAIGIISLSLAPFTGLVMLSNAHTTIVEAIGYLITVLWTKEFILVFARDAIPTLILPLGLILRAFPFFRRTGSSLIALSFAMYFVFPFAIILSNFLIFDIYKPADFSYTPTTASFFGTERAQDDMETNLVDNGKEEADHVQEQFSGPSAVEHASGSASAPCAGNPLWQLFCSFGNLLKSAVDTAGEVASTVANIWRFMVGMTGDFFYTGFNNPLMPASSSAGLFHFIIREVTIISPFVIITMLVTVFEIIITVTGYRSIALTIGGEAELVGLTKVV